MFLDKATFTKVLASTPLVSLDFVIFNGEGKVLLGQRLNRPAQYAWFVPGGRIYKNEPIAAAFARLTQAELGEEIAFANAKLLGAYDHFYQDSVFGEHVSTHYVALAHQFQVAQLNHLPNEQHNQYRWYSVAELLADDQVHPHTKAYFL